jgi:ribonuclease HI/ADP-ribose pyrophosphatase YjhB (NUDIX family)
MKQKVVVKAIIKRQDKVLLLRRQGGRPSIAGKFELPGGKLDTGEQPLDALKRTLMLQTGLAMETVQLFDSVSFVDPDDRELQYVFLVYSVGLAAGDDKITLGGEYSKYVWKMKSEIQQNDVTNSTYILLGLDELQSTGLDVLNYSQIFDDKTTTDENIVIIYSDGGSRGNPGPSAAGFVILDNHENVIFEGGEYLGMTTNNVAEYQAVYLALDKAKAMGAKNIEFRSDSLLVVNQMNGLFQVKNRELWPIHDRLQELVKQFDRVRFVHVKREFNRLADGLVNKILDSKRPTK